MLSSDLNQNAIAELRTSSKEFENLYNEHVKFEQDLEALTSLKYFPPEVELSIKEIKRAKLRGKDRMLQMLAEYKK